MDELWTHEFGSRPSCGFQQVGSPYISLTYFSSTGRHPQARTHNFKTFLRKLSLHLCRSRFRVVMVNVEPETYFCLGGSGLMNAGPVPGEYQGIVEPLTYEALQNPGFHMVYHAFLFQSTGKEMTAATYTFNPSAETGLVLLSGAYGPYEAADGLRDRER